MTALAASVDRVLPEAGLRLRNLPGEITLSSRQARAPLVEPSPALEQEMIRVLEGDPSGLAVTRVSPSRGPAEACETCGEPMSSVLLDLGMGENLGLILEGLDGVWCWSCGSGIARNAQQAVTDRLTRFDPSEEGVAVPSLLYETPAHPRSLQFEISTRCNLACPYCTHRHLPDKRNQTAARFAELLDRVDVQQVENFDFTGLGEPLMNRELVSMVAEVRRRNAHAVIRLVTNGTLLTPRFYEPLCEAGLSAVAVSIDSMDPERFARSRTGATLAPVLANLESLVRYRDGRGLPLRVRIKAVLVEEPYEEAERLLEYSAKLGIDMPHLSQLDSRANATSTYESQWLGEGWSDDGHLLEWAARRWRELVPGGQAFSDPDPGQWPATPAAGFVHPMLLSDPSLCRWAVDAAFLTLDGEALSCCETMIDLPRKTWGSLGEATMGELWTGPLLWGYRLPLALGRLPAGCVGCPQAPREGVPLS